MFRSVVAAVALLGCWSTHADAKVIPNQYIAVYKDQNSMKRTVEGHQKWLQTMFNNEFADETTIVKSEYNFTTWGGYAMEVPEELAKIIEEDGDVTLEKDTTVKLFDKQTNAVPGLARTSGANAVANTGTYSFPSSAGEDVDVYVIDTGIKVNHPLFEGRAVEGASFVNGGEGGDGNGHGTHVAGTIASSTFGIAKKATVISVRVLDADGQGANSGVIGGVNFVVQESKANPSRPCVINMSLGGSASATLDRAVNTAINQGCVVVAAAGNENQDACNTSPARVTNVISVGAIDPRTDRMPTFSNFGRCVDINAPGVKIRSTWIGNSNTDGRNGKTNTISGTSMSSPHVAGVVALLLADSPNLSAIEVRDKLVSIATRDKISNVKRNTPNLILFNNGETGFADGNSNNNDRTTTTTTTTTRARATTTTTTTTTTDGAEPTNVSDASICSKIPLAAFLAPQCKDQFDVDPMIGPLLRQGLVSLQ
ncbi:peptidase S8/S53 domain-containing protein [Cladochytrium replicatum]|nr:peptidase S8/S53 domain-containing protein [Cladochytrium replicatum]